MPSRKKKNVEHIYTLSTFEGETLCVCTSMEKLKEAIGYWMNERPLTTLSYMAWEPNYVHGTYVWGLRLRPSDIKI